MSFSWEQFGAQAGAGVLGYIANRKMRKSQYKTAKAEARALEETKIAEIMEQYNDYLEQENQAVSSAKLAMAVSNIHKDSSIANETLFDMQESYYKNKAQAEENKEFALLEGNINQAQLRYQNDSRRLGNFMQFTADMINAGTSAAKAGG